MDENNGAFVDVEGLGLQTLESTVYEGVSFKAEKGQTIALLGPGGSGKTSLLLTLGGRMKFTSGTATVAGFDLGKQYPKVRDISGISLIKNVNDVQDFLTVRDILAADLALNCKPDNKEAVDAYLADWGFTECQGKKFCDLDTNERCEFDLMLACTNDPELLLIDSVGVGMTHRRTRQFIENLCVLARERDICILFGTYEYDLAMAADGVVVLSEEADEQRLRVIADRGEDAICNVVGSGNGTQPAGHLEAKRRKRKKSESSKSESPTRLSDLFSAEALSFEGVSGKKIAKES